MKKSYQVKKDRKSGDSMTTLYADTINGVSTTGDDCYVTDTLCEQAFFDSLATLGDTEYIKSENVSDELVKKITDIYGIKADTYMDFCYISDIPKQEPTLESLKPKHKPTKGKLHCKFCGSGCDDIGHVAKRSTRHNFVCRDCGAHKYNSPNQKTKWFTKEEWNLWIESVLDEQGHFIKESESHVR